MTTTATVSVRIDPTEPAEARIHQEGNQTIIVAGRVELHCDHWHDRHTPRALSEWLRDLAAQVEDEWNERELTELAASAHNHPDMIAALEMLRRVGTGENRR